MINLEQLYEIQSKLDRFIVNNMFNVPDEVDHNDEGFLSDRILALFTEVGEFANTTRCFKYWSVKGMDSREKMLNEYVDILHFYLSIGNTMRFTALEVETAYMKKNKINYDRQRNGY